MTSPPKLRPGGSAMLQLVQLVALAGIGWYAIIPSFYETNGWKTPSVMPSEPRWGLALILLAVVVATVAAGRPRRIARAINPAVSMSEESDVSDDELSDEQFQSAAQQLGDAFTRLDQEFLAMLTPEERAAQAKVRFDLYMHVDKVWEAPKHRGENSVDVPGYDAVAGMRDLLMTLLVNAQDAQHAADDVPELYSVKVVVTKDEEA
ncbi:hypothetical protein ACSNOB_16955 [Micromonospora sp. URMC 106]|uniref:hypothetical protein n=1 Tax=Micromonospora sp. URMC 106 TaxID=3423408 RepID=UPI003F1AC883